MALLVALLAAVVVMVVGVQKLDWGNPELASMFVTLAVVLAVVGGLALALPALFVTGAVLWGARTFGRR